MSSDARAEAVEGVDHPALRHPKPHRANRGKERHPFREPRWELGDHKAVASWPKRIQKLPPAEPVEVDTNIHDGKSKHIDEVVARIRARKEEQ